MLLVLARRLAVDNPASESVEEFSGTKLKRGELLRNVAEGILAERPRRWQLLGPFWAALQAMSGSPFSTLPRSRFFEYLPICLAPGTGPVARTRPPKRPRKGVIRRPNLYLLARPSISKRRRTRQRRSQGLPAGLRIEHAPRLSPWNIQTEYSHCYPSGWPLLLSLCGQHFQGVPPQWAALLKEDLIDDVIRSLVAGSSGKDAFIYTAVPGKPALLTLYDELETNTAGLLSFEICDETGVIELNSPIPRGLVATEGGLVLNGNEVGEINIHPEFVTVCGELSSTAKL